MHLISVLHCLPALRPDDFLSGLRKAGASAWAILRKSDCDCDRDRDVYYQKAFPIH